LPSVDVRATSQNTLRFTWTQTSQNIANNTSTVTWQMQILSTGSGRISSSASKAWSVTVNGTRYSGNNTIGMSANTTRTVASGSTVISHDTNGTKTFPFSFSQTFDITFSGSWVGTISGSGSGDLTTIPRTSNVTLSASSINIGSSITINTNRANSAFTHQIHYSFNGGGWTTINNSVGASVAYSTPSSWNTLIPNATSASVRIRCVTYSGSSRIGESIATFTANVPANVVPSVSAISATEATTTPSIASTIQALVQGYSGLRVVTTAAGAQGSTISSYRTTLVNNSTTLHTGNTRDFTTGALNASGAVAVTSTVTDSRGRTASRTLNVTFLAYSPPVITTFTAFRANTSGATTNGGTSLRSNYNYSITTLNNRNTRSFTIRYKLNTASSWTTATSGTAYSASSTTYRRDNTFTNTEQTYDVEMVVTDFFTSTTMALQVGGEIVPLSINATGRGVGIGGHSTKDALEVYMNAEFTGDVKMNMGGDQILRNTNGTPTITSSAESGGLWANGGWRAWTAASLPRVSVINTTTNPNPNIRTAIRINNVGEAAYIAQDNVPVIAGMKYTMSVDMRRISGTTTCRLYVRHSTGATSAVDVNPTSTIGRYSFTFTALGSATDIVFGVNAGTNNVEFSGMKLEVGSMDTGWRESSWASICSITTSQTWIIKRYNNGYVELTAVISRTSSDTAVQYMNHPLPENLRLRDIRALATPTTNGWNLNEYYYNNEAIANTDGTNSSIRLLYYAKDTRQYSYYFNIAVSGWLA